MLDTSVKFLASSYSGAPVINGATLGSGVDALYACFCTGFGSVALSSLVVSSGVATATVSAGHGFVYAASSIGPVIRISGASPAGLNGDFRVTIPSATVFTFPCPGISDQSATGSIAAKRAPLGWERVFSGTNKAVFRSLNNLGPRRYFRVQHIAADQMTVQEYISMTDVDTGLNPGNLTIFCRIYITSTTGGNLVWSVTGDDRTVWFNHIEKSSNLHVLLGGFGDFNPTSPSDVNAALTVGAGGIRMKPTDSDDVLAGYSGSGYWDCCNGHGFASNSAKQFTYLFPSLNASATGTNWLTGSREQATAFPNPVTGQADAGAIYVVDSNAVRGTFRGISAPLAADNLIPTLVNITLPNGRLGIKLNMETWQSGVSRYGCVLADLIGPW